MEIKKEEIKEALQKQAMYGPDVDIDTFESEIESDVCYDDLDAIPSDVRENLERVGMDLKQDERTGTYIQNNDKVDFCHNTSEDVIVMPISEALKKYEWLEDYWWKAVSSTTDKYTAAVAVREKIMGYFIYAKKGAKNIFPLQTCLFTQIDGFKQIVHNIVIAEEGAELNIITGCTTHGKAKRALHLGVSEMYVKKNAKISFTMIHDWKEASEIRPRTGVIVEEGGSFINNYVVMSPVKTLQSNPKFRLIGPNANVFSQTLIYAKGNSFFDVGGDAILEAENCSAELISRIVAVDTAEVISRAKITAQKAGASGHIDCTGLLLNENAVITAVPVLDARHPDIRLTHEAAVGKISDTELEYLQARGIPEDEARGLIIRGFLDANTSYLPEALAKETQRLINRVADSEMA